MKRISKAFCILIVMLMLFTCMPFVTDCKAYAAAKATVTTTEKVKILESGLRMRSSYSTSSKIKGKVTKNKVYQLKKKTKDGEWGQLKSNGYWIYLKGYTKVVKDTVSTNDKVKILVSDLRMRTSYTTGSSIKGKLTKGKVYQLKKKTKDGEWGQLKSNGYWIYLKGYTSVYKDTSTQKETVKTDTTVTDTTVTDTTVTDTTVTDTTVTDKTVQDENTSDKVTVVNCDEKVKVTVTGLRMRDGYSTSAKIMGKVNLGVVYELKAKTSDGEWGQLKDNGYWIYLKNYTVAVEEIDDPNVVYSSDVIKITVGNLNMRESYTTTSKIVGSVKKGVCYKLKAKTKDGAWGQLEKNNYWIYLSGYSKTVSKYTYLSESAKVNQGKAVSGIATGDEVIEYAKLFLGNPYVYGGTNLLNGTDCSGYVMSIYEHFGIQLPHASGKQVMVGKEVAYEDAKPGDIICYSGHVALYMGNNTIIHASTPATGIKISTNAKYKPIKSVRRIFE